MRYAVPQVKRLSGQASASLADAGSLRQQLAGARQQVAELQSSSTLQVRLVRGRDGGSGFEARTE